VAVQPALGFAGLLRQLRTEARLTQEELAEAAGLSPRSVSDLERGINRTARKDTAVLLAGALSLARPVAELFIAAARGRAPATDVLAARQREPATAGHNLPLQLTRLLGRERELAALQGLIGKARLVTLTGAGGVGKTRLAVELAAGVLGRFPDGAWLADLASLTDPELVPSLVMETLGVRQGHDVPVMEALSFRLRSAGLLLILDNCEHLLSACTQLTVTLLGGSRGLRVLATSREPLGVPGEAVYVVPPLAVPLESAGEEALADAAAVRLFLERGSAARAGTGLEAAPVAAVARICRELDGLPLAIELAAARTSVLSVEEIETYLADKFGLLTYRRPVADRRQQALKTTIGWSYELLPAQEARVLRELSVFAGGFGLAAVAPVCCGGDEAAALDMIDRLVSKSLVVPEPTVGGTRYRLLETIRQYAAARLAEAGEAGQARQRHAAAFLDLAERERGLACLVREHDNFRAALGFTLSSGCDPGDGETGPRLACALGGFWLACGFIKEGQGWLERALGCSGDQRLRADLLRLLGAVLYEAGDLPRADTALAQGSRVAAAAGLVAAQARIGLLLAAIHVAEDVLNKDALAECEAAAALLESEVNLAGLAEAWLLIGRLRFIQGDAPGGGEAFERAAAYAEQSSHHYAQQAARCWLVVTYQVLSIPADVAIDRSERLLEAASGNPWAEAAIAGPLSVVYAFAGRFADARTAIARSQSISIRSGAKLSWALCAMLAGEVEMIAGNPAAAEQVLREGYEALRAMGERGFLSGILGMLAEAVYAQGRFGEAQRLTEEVQAVAGADDIAAQTQWRATSAKLLARRGQFPAATQLADEAEALILGTSYASLLAEALVAKAEVSRLAGALDEAEASLRKALRIYEDRRAVPLTERTQAALARLTVRPRTGPV